MSIKYTHLSVFDLDHTLLTNNSSQQFGLFLFKHKLLSHWALTHALLNYTAHRFQMLSLQKLHHNIFRRCFQGVCLRFLKKQVQFFLKDYLQIAIRNSILTLLKQAKQEQHYIILLSSSPDFLVDPIAEYLGVHEWASTPYYYDHEDKLQRVGKVFDGEAKANYLALCLEKLQLQAMDTSVYTDSHLDLVLLETAGRPIAVHPDAKLKRICQKNQWKIIINS